MYRSTSGLVLLLAFHLALASTGHGDPPPPFSSPPPAMGEALLIGDILILSRGIPLRIAENRAGTREIDNRLESYTYTVERVVTVPREEAIAPSDYRILNMEGKPVDAATLAERFSKPMPALVAEQERRVDSKYLQMYKPDTLIIYLRPQRPGVATSAGGAIAPPAVTRPPSAPAPAPIPSPPLPSTPAPVPALPGRPA